MIMMLVDSIMLVSILLASFSIRLGYMYFPQDDIIFWEIFSAPFFGIVIFHKFGLYRSVNRYVGFQAVWSVVQAVSLYSLIWALIAFLATVDGIPRSVVLINWFLSILVIVGLRLLARWLFTKGLTFRFNIKKRIAIKNVLIYGAGTAGVQLAGALNHSPEYVPVGFIDDSKEKHKTVIWGLDVYSPDNISNLITNFNVNEILIALPNVSRARRFKLVNFLEPFQVQVRLLPNVSDLAGGKVSVDDLHQVNIEDLLGRDTAPTNQKLLSKNVKDKSVVITGAGGSIGSELSRQIAFLQPKALILFEMNELALYNIEKEIIALEIKKLKVYPILGSINNSNRVNKVFKHFMVDTIYHAAAYKHVPMVEFNNAEGVDNNIFGTLNCAQAAIDSGVETFVLISTDKAVRPTNTMGATKRTAELILQGLSTLQSVTKFSMVRFGNVLDSSGSVIPLFRKQIQYGGPVTVTDKKIIRYFMMISEAVGLVIQAGAMGTGGDVFILDMGEPVSIDNLAKKMIKLSGLQLKDDSNPDGDIEIKYTGLRPGEKLYEELLIGDDCSNTDNLLIMRAKEDMMSWNDLKPLLDNLKKEMIDCDQEKIRELLIQIVPEFVPDPNINDILYKKD